MNWIRDLFTRSESTATSCLILAIVIALGFAIGSIRVRGIRFGVAGVLFAGLLCGHFRLTASHHVLEFVREFGLVLFVYTLGLSVGPGFINALRSEGLRLNLLSCGTVINGVILTILIWVWGGVSMPVAVGLYSGAITNTPSLAAATQALQDVPVDPQKARQALVQVEPDEAQRIPTDRQLTEIEQKQLSAEIAKMPGLGYAISYPFGVIGIILTMLMLRMILRADPAQEAKELEHSQESKRPRIERWSVQVTNTNFSGQTLSSIPILESIGVNVSRVLRGKDIVLAHPNLQLQLGDILLAVGTLPALEQFRIIVGQRVEMDLTELPGPLTSRWMLVSRHAIVGSTIPMLEGCLQHQIQVTRLRRS